MKKYAVIYLAWGEKYLNEVISSLRESVVLEQYDIVLLTDDSVDQFSSDELGEWFDSIIKVNFKLKGLLRKAEIYDYIPDGYASYLFLDSDTFVLEDISLGFEKAMRSDVALSPAPHYSLDYFWGFDKIMLSEGSSLKGQIQYNTGVIFFKKTLRVKSIFMRWKELVERYGDRFENDQPFFTLAMEQLEFVPYTLSISYNYRGFGDAISGIVRIWHSRGIVPENINEFEVSWPPRRAWPNRVKYFNKVKRYNVPMRIMRKLKLV